MLFDLRLNGDQVCHRCDHAAKLLAVAAHRAVAGVVESKRARGRPLAFVAAIRCTHLADRDIGHQTLTLPAVSSDSSCSALSRAAGATSSSDSPRRAATVSGDSRVRSALSTACTMLIGLAVPSDLVNTSRTPAASSTARTGPPAITPVPGAAGRCITTPAACSPWIGCWMVPWIIGTLKKFFLASSTPLAIAVGTSLALP